MTESATVTPRFIDQPFGNAKLGKITLPDKSIYRVPPAMLPLFKIGVPVMIQFDPLTRADGAPFLEKDGQPMRKVTKVTPVAGANGAAPGGFAGAGKPYQERRDIFVCGAFNNLCASGNIQVDEQVVVDTINILCRSWAKSELAQTVTAPAPKPPTAADEMEDEIPF